MTTHAPPAQALGATWYHGGRRLRRGEAVRWDRDRTTSSLNAEGPGMYFTTSPDEAAGYVDRASGEGLIYTMRLPSNFRLVPKKKPSLRDLQSLYESASEESQEIFVSNWSIEWPAPPRRALEPYTRQVLLHDACVTLYGDLFRYDADEYLAAMSSLGYDGAAFQVGTTGGSARWLHLVAWNLERLTLEEA